MTYLRSLFFNFLIVFFVVRVMPGITIEYYEKVPNIGSDILFSFIVGFLNSIIVPFLIIFDLKPSKAKIAVLGFLISFLSFLLIAIFSFGIQAQAIGVVLGGLSVWLVSFFTNYLELQHNNKKH